MCDPRYGNCPPSTESQICFHSKANILVKNSHRRLLKTGWKPMWAPLETIDKIEKGYRMKYPNKSKKVSVWFAWIIKCSRLRSSENGYSGKCCRLVANHYSWHRHWAVLLTWMLKNGKINKNMYIFTCFPDIAYEYEYISMQFTSLSHSITNCTLVSNIKKWKFSHPLTCPYLKPTETHQATSRPIICFYGNLHHAVIARKASVGGASRQGQGSELKIR